MSDNTLVIQSINGSLNVVITTMEEVRGEIYPTARVLKGALEHSKDCSSEELAYLGFIARQVVSELEASK